eukprot:scaffold260048_cov31-Tisochrysis_lutea.AAC.2
MQPRRDRWVAARRPTRVALDMPASRPPGSRPNYTAQSRQPSPSQPEGRLGWSHVHAVRSARAATRRSRGWRRHPPPVDRRPPPPRPRCSRRHACHR